MNNYLRINVLWKYYQMKAVTCKTIYNDVRLEAQKYKPVQGLGVRTCTKHDL